MLGLLWSCVACIVTLHIENMIIDATLCCVFVCAVVDLLLSPNLSCN